jgi:hypothetical protein
MCAHFEPLQSLLKKVNRRSKRARHRSVSELAPEERAAYSIGSSLQSRGLSDSHASLQNVGSICFDSLLRTTICPEQSEA